MLLAVAVKVFKWDRGPFTIFVILYFWSFPPRESYLLLQVSYPPAGPYYQQRDQWQITNICSFMSGKVAQKPKDAELQRGLNTDSFLLLLLLHAHTTIHQPLQPISTLNHSKSVKTVAKIAYMPKYLLISSDHLDSCSSHVVIGPNKHNSNLPVVFICADFEGLAFNEILRWKSIFHYPFVFCSQYTFV